MRKPDFEAVIFRYLPLALCSVTLCLAQTERASLSGRVTDPSGAAVVDANIQATNTDTNFSTTSRTNIQGLYVLPSLPPGRYRLSVSKQGFKTITKVDLILHVQDAIAQNFSLPVGSFTESITISGETPLVNTENAAVSTVIDRNFAENLPMNGRSFQTLIQLTPGVVVTPSSAVNPGQFSVNGQRTSSNYWMVDGVSANAGISAGGYGAGTAGGVGVVTVQGGTNGLVSVDAMQEFRIQTSTYAPEFGRAPGAQISILTRSGTNQFHGTVFDYFRNDVLDANDWFADHTGQPKPEERQNDFGMAVGGPLAKDRSFFFVSYEGLRLRLPQVAETLVPSLAARQNAIPAVQPFLNAFPLPNGPVSGTDQDAFNSSFSNSSTLDAASLRIDYRLTDRTTLFARYNYSPSALADRGSSTELASINRKQIRIQTATFGATWAPSSTIANDFRFNYSRTDASSAFDLDAFGGAVPLTAAGVPFPNPFTTRDSLFGFAILSLGNDPGFNLGKFSSNRQQQINLVNSLSWQKGTHGLKFGIDFRLVFPSVSPSAYFQIPLFADVASAESGTFFFAQIQAFRNAALLFRNLGLFSQDTWRINPRLTLTYGVRWDVDFTPESRNGPSLAAAMNFDRRDFSTLGLAPPGTPLFKTQYSNFAPRFGLAYQLSDAPGRETVIRGGLGVFYDLATSEVGNAIAFNYPFGAGKFPLGGTFPLDPATAAPPTISAASLGQSANGTTSLVVLFDPKLSLPYTLQFNLALERSLGSSQSISASYIGALGRKLLATETPFNPNPQITFPQIDLNAGSSEYHALQIQYHRKLSRGIEALASYSWSHSIDTGSVSGYGSVSNTIDTKLGPEANRGPSDFDLRHAFSAGVTWVIPQLKVNRLAQATFGGWSLQNVIQAHSAPPVDVLYSFVALNGEFAAVRPDRVPGLPFSLYGSQYPGGKIFNASAFTPPPIDPNTGSPLRQGNLGRNALRGFNAAQWDFAIHREFRIYEALRLQFRAEMFNVLNHPNFGSPIGDLQNPQSVNPQFGQSIQMLGRSLTAQNTGAGALDSLYQVGGPRSIQLALKLQF